MRPSRPAALLIALACAGCSQDLHVLDHDAGDAATTESGVDAGAGPDSAIDLATPDSGCASCPACRNGVDDDGDSLIDYPLDPDCTSRDDDDESAPPPPAACANDVDDDHDGHADYPADRGCANEEDDDETDPPPPACSNGADDDGDGHADYPLDPGCTDARDGDESDGCPGAASCPECGNGIDDDGDGHIDAPGDPECSAASDTSERCVLVGDGFEDDWPGSWASEAGPVMGSRRLSAAHDGAYGLYDPMFVTFEPTVLTGRPGETASVYTKAFGDPTSTVVSLHFAIAGSTSYACMMNLANELTVYAYGPNVVLASIAFTRAPSTWYRLEAAFAAGGVVECRVYADGGTAPLAAVSHTFGTSLDGPVGLRGFALAAFDTLTVCR